MSLLPVPLALASRTCCIAGYTVSVAGPWKQVRVLQVIEAERVHLVVADGTRPIVSIWLPTQAPAPSAPITCADGVTIAIDTARQLIVIGYVTPRDIHAPRGQALPLLALVLTLLIAFTALAIDGALAYATREKQRGITDMAALVGARSLLFESTAQESGRLQRVQAAVAAYVADARTGMSGPAAQVQVMINDGTGTGMTIASPTDTRWPSSDMVGVTVVVTSTMDTYLLGAFGYPQLRIVTDASSRFGSAGTADGADMWPFGVSQAAAQQIFQAGNAGILLDMDGQIADSNDALGCALFDPADPLRPLGCVDTFIRQEELRTTRIGTGDPTPPVGGGGSCAAADVPESTTHYWCRGGMRDSVIRNSAPNAPANQIRRETIGNSPSNGWPIASGLVSPHIGETGIVPVLVDAFDTTADSGWMTIEYFLPITIVAQDSGKQTLRVRYMEPFMTGGALAAMTNNDNHGAALCMPCVINQVK